jgi:hypothetical protein
MSMSSESIPKSTTGYANGSELFSVTDPPMLSLSCVVSHGTD